MGQINIKSDRNHVLTAIKEKANISQSLFETIQQIITHIVRREYHEIDQELMRVSTLNCTIKSHICMFKSTNPSTMYQCSNCSLMDQQYFCEDCFVHQFHQDHQFSTVSSEVLRCSCGNQHHLKSHSFCKFHGKQTISSPDVQKSERFKSDCKILLELIFLMKDSFLELGLSQESYLFYTQILLKYLLRLTEASEFSQVLISEVLLSRRDYGIFSQLKMSQEGETLLEYLINIVRENFNAELVELIERVLEVGQLGRELLRVYYNKLLRQYKSNSQLLKDESSLQLQKKDRADSIDLIFSLLNPSFLLYNQFQVEYFRDPANCNFYFDSYIKDNNRRNMYYQYFTLTLEGLLKLKLKTQIFENILQRTRVCDLFNFLNYYQNNSNTTINYNRQVINVYFILQGIINSIKNKSLLQEISASTFREISKRTNVTFNFTMERAFTLSTLAFFDFNLPSKLDLEKILSLQFSQIFTILINYTTLRDKFKEEYHELVVNNKQTTFQIAPLSILSTDQMCLQLLGNCLSELQILQLYKKFINVLKQAQMVQQQCEKTILSTSLQKFISIISVFLNAFCSNLGEIILKSNYDNNSERLLSILLVLFDGTNATEFKNIAANFADSGEIIKFIKGKTVVQNKKIHSKMQNQYPFNVVMFSEYLPEKAQQQLIQRMFMLLQNNSQNELSGRFFSEDNLKIMMLFLAQFLNGMDMLEQSVSKLQKQIIMALEVIIQLILETKNQGLVELAFKFFSKLQNCPAKLSICVKKIEQRRKKNPDNERKVQSDKKRKQKMNILKQKQKLTLSAYKMDIQEEKKQNECIVCKNSKPGHPLLLANFRYNNFLEKQLKVGTPFLEFGSCGHYIHQQCLEQSHKGEFKIWYPCILCKSISNILLPQSGQEGEQSQRTRNISFLSNFGGIYTFFYRNGPLLQFTADTVAIVFPLLFKTLAYQISVYPLLNLQYFQRSQYPLIKFFYDLLVMASELKITNICPQYSIEGNVKFISLFQYVYSRLKFCICKETTQEITNQLIQNQQIPVEVQQLLNSILSALEKRVLCPQFKEVKTDVYKTIAASQISKPPADIQELQNHPKQCSSCNLVGTSHQTCLLCDWNCCLRCLDVRKVHSKQIHLGQAVFICSDDGRYTYIHDQLTGQFQSLYIDFLGEELKSKNKAQKEQFTLNPQSWQSIVNDLWSNRLHRQIMKFHQ